ncbi:hypothetical protein IscW_ISCW023271 [Ixodes scapularis]|uniref:Sushi domain-containing protein n=1 Tax=Ixodes scapularis TaxID=6945 RepID=B7QJW1_IXOSC|nr:hypothetical protein IscW_ISCW023271 [Ixodes scapularis]|eukprot:XP_002415468.1 hypothetical protein IscW_ISCW023271 [Ixodes scapularis]
MFAALLFFAVLGASSSCDRAERPHNAGEFYSTSPFVNGTTVHYVCDPGYEILGPQRRTCHQNGSWIPLGLPFCVTDVAKGKKVRSVSSSDTEAERTLNCSDSDLKTTHSWYVDLDNRYSVLVLSLDFERSNDEQIDMELTVGDSIGDSDRNSICSKYRGTYRTGQTVYFLCPEPLIGRYVIALLRSASPFQLPFCFVHVMSDQAPPIEEPTTTAGSTTLSSDDPQGTTSWFVARVVGISAGAGGVSVLLALVIVLAVHKLRRRNRHKQRTTLFDTPTVFKPYVMDPVVLVSEGTTPGLTWYVSTSNKRRIGHNQVLPPIYRNEQGAIICVPVKEKAAKQVEVFRESEML